MQKLGSPQAYQQFRTFLESACGILLGDNKEYLVNSRLKSVLARNSLNDLGELVEKLESRSSIALREEVVDAMTTNETLWFRDLHPFRILDEMLFDELEKEARTRPLNIWSAACSTGQEPYSIAMVADEYKKKNLGKFARGLKIVATDISASVLEKAKSGEYEMLALGRGMSDERLRRYFQALDDGRWKVNVDIAAQVSFRSLNLLQSYSMLPGPFDVVFCRNVLIYFSQDLKRDILTRIHGKLRKGGYLFLGASESMSGLNDKFEMVQCNPGIIYRAK
ncbi:MAG: chemotaxis protein [Oleiphilus sp.]|nr:MAG: chemotaxis protein [Oleiphilus sp.]